MFFRADIRRSAVDSACAIFIGKGSLPLTAFRLAFRAYRDFYDQIWWLMLVLVAWWILTATVVFAPSATLLLFHQADPRRGAWDERIGFRGFARFLLDNFVRGWTLALAVLPLIGLITFNLSYYGGGDTTLAVLAPIWLVLLIMGITAAVVVFSVAWTTNLPPSECLKTGLRMTGVRLPTALVILFLTGLLPVLLISTLPFLYPLVLSVPGIVATAFSTFVLKAMRVAIPEPNKPTDERLHEKRSD